MFLSHKDPVTFTDDHDGVAFFVSNMYNCRHVYSLFACLKYSVTYLMD